jgi:hypothetical protein
VLSYPPCRYLRPTTPSPPVIEARRSVRPPCARSNNSTASCPRPPTAPSSTNRTLSAPPNSEPARHNSSSQDLHSPEKNPRPCWDRKNCRPDIVGDLPCIDPRLFPTFLPSSVLVTQLYLCFCSYFMYNFPTGFVELPAELLLHQSGAFRILQLSFLPFLGSGDSFQELTAEILASQEAAFRS